MPTPLDILRQRNVASGKPAQLTGGQRGGIAGTIAVILASTYAVEGGYVNDPHDHGGATRYGITERNARADGYTGDMRNFPKHCAGDITVCADKIYVQRYIEDPGFTPMLSIEPAVARELVDTAVNSGPRKSSIFFQASVNVLCHTKLTVDGRVGPSTIAAYRACKAVQGAPLCPTMLNALDGAQERFYRAIVAHDRSQAIYLRGWLGHRINNVPRSACGK